MRNSTRNSYLKVAFSLTQGDSPWDKTLLCPSGRDRPSRARPAASGSSVCPSSDFWASSQVCRPFEPCFPSASNAAYCCSCAPACRDPGPCRSVWAFESIQHYNIEGRSPTDGNDQLRKKLQLSERRTQRAGRKGMDFCFDLVFNNAHIMRRDKQPRSMPRRKLDLLFTKVRFCRAYADKVIRRSLGIRRKTPARMLLLAAAVKGSQHVPKLPSPTTAAARQADAQRRAPPSPVPMRNIGGGARDSVGGGTRGATAAAAAEAAGCTSQFFLTDPNRMVQEERIERAKRGHRPVSAVKRKGDKRGRCALEGCNRKPKRPRYWCPGSNEGDGAYWHLECFFEKHTCVPR